MRNGTALIAARTAPVRVLKASPAGRALRVPPRKGGPNPLFYTAIRVLSGAVPILVGVR